MAKLFKISILIAFLPVLIFVGIAYTNASMTIGISPHTTSVDDVANNVKFERYVSVKKSISDHDKYFKATVLGPGASHIELSEEVFKFGKDETSYKYKFYIAPKNASNGKYEAKITFIETVPQNSAGVTEGGSGMNLKLGTTAFVEFTVTDKEVKKVVVASMNIFDTEENDDVILEYTAMNQGNVMDNVDQIALTLEDYTDPTNVYSATNTVSFKDLISPGANKKNSMKFKFKNLVEGKYLATISFIDNNKVIFSREKVSINVYQPGTLNQVAEFYSLDLSSTQMEPNELLKFSANITNKGNIYIQPVLYIEIEKDDKIIEILRSEQQGLLKGQNTTYDLTYRPQERGEYTAKAYFKYGIKSTESIEKTFKVGSVNVVMIGIIAGIALLIILVVIVIIVIIKKRKNKNNGKKTIEKKTTTKKVNKEKIEKKIKPKKKTTKKATKKIVAKKTVNKKIAKKSKK